MVSRARKGWGSGGKLSICSVLFVQQLQLPKNVYHYQLHRPLSINQFSSLHVHLNNVRMCVCLYLMFWSDVPSCQFVSVYLLPLFIPNQPDHTLLWMIVIELENKTAAFAKAILVLVVVDFSLLAWHAL